MDWGQKITYLAETNVKGKQTRFGIKDHDRLEHMSVVGRVGSDRAALLTTMALQDIGRGMGVLVLDAAGYFSELLLERLPVDALNRLVYVDPSDAEFPFSWNSVDDFRSIQDDQEAFMSLIDVLSVLYRTPRSQVVEFVAEELLNRENATMLLLYELVQDQSRRDALLPKGSPERKDFESCLANSADSVELIREHGRYLAKDSLMRNLLGQQKSKFTLEVLMRGGIVVVDVSRIRVFPTRITPLVRLFTHAARARRQSASEPFSVYLYDVVRYLPQGDIEQFLPERALSFTLSDGAYFEEDREARAGVLARSGTVAAFSPSHADAPLVERIFFPYVGLEDLSKLEAGECAMLLSIDSVRSRPFFARVLPLPERQNVSIQDIHVLGRDTYAVPRRQADQLFIERTPLPPGGPGMGGAEPGSFSNAFRSIFAKSAAGAAPGAGAPPAASPAPLIRVSAPPPESSKKEKKADAQKPAEVSEEELRQMLYVNPPSP